MTIPGVLTRDKWRSCIMHHSSHGKYMQLVDSLIRRRRCQPGSNLFRSDGIAGTFLARIDVANICLACYCTHTRFFYINTHPPTMILRFPVYSPSGDDWSFPSLRDIWIPRQRETMHRGTICPMVISRQLTLAKSTLFPLHLTQASTATLYR